MLEVVGDRVEMIEEGLWARKGDKGKIVVIEDIHIGVRFDRDIQAHDLGGSCESGYGEWVLEDDIKKIHNPYPARTIALMKACQAS